MRALKGSMSSVNKANNAAPMYKPNNPIDRTARKALSKAAVAKGGTIKLSGDVVSLASKKTVAKAAATAKKRSK